MKRAVARVLALIAERPAEPSWLDRRDGVGAVGPFCSVLSCQGAPVAAPHGWHLCETHNVAA